MNGHNTFLHDVLRRFLNTPAPPYIVALVGPGGIGKTALAHSVTMRWIEEERIDDVVWLTLELPISYASLLALIAANLGYLHLVSANQAELEIALRERFAEAGGP